MKTMLLGFAAAAAAIAAAAPVHAQQFTSEGSAPSFVFNGPNGFPNWAARPNPADRTFSRSGCHRGHCGGQMIADGGFGYYYNPEINRSWDSDSFNDWWNDRPDRAYPAWMHHNQNCDRMWWGGGVWRCTW